MLDELTLTVHAGPGGSGIVSFRREKYVPRGGPDGGNGGHGGNVVLVADPAVRVLDGLRRKRTVKAEAGRDGGPAKRHGRDGKDAVLRVPIGTLAWECNGEEVLVADLSGPDQAVVVARGGVGGRGNASLTSSTRQAPRIAERGLSGESRRIRLELRLLAEAGLVGLPNAGKSSLLRAVSEARPKVGAYPFTTLEPYLGVAEVGYETLVVADIPGLIEGAHEGAGLGIGFLQHIRRTQVLIHVVDVTEPDPLATIDVLRGELSAYGHGLEEKPWIAAPNKIDLPGARERADEIQRALRRRGIEAVGISALTGEGVERLMQVALDMVSKAREQSAREQAKAAAPKVEVSSTTYEVVRTKAGFAVRGERPERAAAMLGADSPEARGELVRRLQRMGVLNALRRKGAREGDMVRIDGVELEWPL